jgi:hypothetical protein
MTNLETFSITNPRSIPSTDEIRLSNSVIKILDKDIEDLEVQLEALQNRLQNLRQRRANYASYISSFRRLPTELLRDILNICLLNGQDILVFTQVCSRLREVAIGMTHIWSKISLRSMERIQRYRRTSSWRCYGSSSEVSCSSIEAFLIECLIGRRSMCNGRAIDIDPCTCGVCFTKTAYSVACRTGDIRGYIIIQPPCSFVSRLRWFQYTNRCQPL